MMVGDLVKVLFPVEDSGDGITGERLWVKLTKLGPDRFQGILKNQPVVVDLEYNQLVSFPKNNIVSIT